MLKEITLKENYKVINKKVYAVIKEIGGKRELDPCKVRAELAKENATLEAEKLTLENRLAEITNQIFENAKLDNEIAALGFCKIDRPKYKKIDGIIIKDSLGNPIIDSYIHQSTCPNPNKEG